MQPAVRPCRDRAVDKGRQPAVRPWMPIAIGLGGEWLFGRMVGCKAVDGYGLGLLRMFSFFLFFSLYVPFGSFDEGASMLSLNVH